MLRCVLVSDPLCGARAPSFDLTFNFFLSTSYPGMDDTIDVVIVTRSLNDIDRREPRH